MNAGYVHTWYQRVIYIQLTTIIDTYQTYLGGDCKYHQSLINLCDKIVL